MEEVFRTFGAVVIILIFVVILVSAIIWLYEKTESGRKENPFLHGVIWAMIGMVLIFLITFGAVTLKHSGLLEDEEPVQEQSYDLYKGYRS